MRSLKGIQHGFGLVVVGSIVLGLLNAVWAVQAFLDDKSGVAFFMAMLAAWCCFMAVDSARKWRRIRRELNDS